MQATLLHPSSATAAQEAVGGGLSESFLRYGTRCQVLVLEATDAAKRAPAPGPLAQNGSQRHTIDPLVGGRAAAAEVAVEVQRVQQRCRGGGGDE